MTPEELRQISDRVGDVEGWDFSCVQVVEEDPPWRYDEIVHRYLDDSCVIDLGTGGGEIFLRFAGQIRRGFGIDQSVERLQAARRNREQAEADNVSFLEMDVASLAFPNNSFDLVLASFASYDVGEVSRVLRPGGVFITQQIGDHDSQSIFDAFGWGSYGRHWRERFEAQGAVYTPTAETARYFEAAGCSVISYEEYDIRQHYLDVGSLVFFLKASPLPWPWDPETYAAPITALIERHGGERGIETNAHRELLIVQH